MILGRCLFWFAAMSMCFSTTPFGVIGPMTSADRIFPLSMVKYDVDLCGEDAALPLVQPE